MRTAKHIGLIIPLANESSTFLELLFQLKIILKKYPIATLYLVVDKASIDNTLELCQTAAKTDAQITCVYAPETKNVVEAYLAGFRAAMSDQVDLFIEMDAGLAHDPNQIPNFIAAYEQGYDCVFGSRFINNGALINANFKRRFFSKGGTITANLFLGTKLKDMTSGFEAYDKNIMQQILAYPLRSKAHFIQTELRYLCRHKNSIEIPILHKSPDPQLRLTSIKNAISCLGYYFFKRISFQAKQFR